MFLARLWLHSLNFLTLNTRAAYLRKWLDGAASFLHTGARHLTSNAQPSTTSDSVAACSPFVSDAWLNAVAANDPVEDRFIAEPRLRNSNASLFAVFDGHSGVACADAASRVMGEYVSAAECAVSGLYAAFVVCLCFRPMLTLYFLFFCSFCVCGRSTFVFLAQPCH